MQSFTLKHISIAPSTAYQGRFPGFARVSSFDNPKLNHGVSKETTGFLFGEQQHRFSKEIQGRERETPGFSNENKAWMFLEIYWGSHGNPGFPR
eukprot:NODE_3096_length_423_cov_157.628342_g2581_i0.p1 GENE.NODE_3096_length_423_cov_157.628342_g2581_i0~~NODE_3096_length_423_cov_157.628342_g2581_i0.p1  ORF type:complete len:94 (+),score=1.03 NODE_3096_length_423_cov_157.628342_g2581_i0:104-385(+)